MPLVKQSDLALIAGASKILRHSSSFGYWLGTLFFELEYRQILFLAYAYFRWLDDIVDMSDMPWLRKCELVHRQMVLADNWYNGAQTVWQNEPEAMLYYAISYDVKREGRLRLTIFGFLNALEWDVKRVHLAVTRAELDSYSLWLGQAYAAGLLYGLGVNPDDPSCIAPRDMCGTASHLVHVLRDLLVDFRLGYWNISKEDQAEFDINLCEPDLSCMQKWVQATSDRAMSLFEAGLAYRSDLPTYKTRLVFDLTCLKYMRTLKKIVQQWTSIKQLEQLEFSAEQELLICSEIL